MPPLSPTELMAIREAHCPDCGGSLLRGPRGGATVNIKCITSDHEFNVSFWGRMALGERLISRVEI